MKEFARKLGMKKLIFFAVCLVLLLAALGCFLGIHRLSRLLPSQLEAERWQGGSEVEYAQISCFIPVDETVSLNQIGAFREAMAKKLHEAALDVGTEGVLTADAWSRVSKVSVSSALGKGDVYATAVGGEFFSFHPITLISGNYISSTDLMQDRALLDEETAWLLFGGTDIQGLTFKINGVPFVVAGVIEREQDFATKMAYTDGMGIFISYDAWVTLSASSTTSATTSTGTSTGSTSTGTTSSSTSTSTGTSTGTSTSTSSSSTSTNTASASGGIQCYEVVLPNPVKNFALGVVKEKFPIGRGEIVNNTERFGTSNLWKLVRSFSTRSMQTRGVMYPYWENAARCVEDRAALLLLAGIAALALPCGTALVYAVKYAVIGKRKLEEDIIPNWRDSAEEAIRVRARRRWEKKHGKGSHEA